jgi:Glycosyl transferase WecG/TagA/CpsF family
MCCKFARLFPCGRNVSILTRSEGSLSAIWRAVGSAHSVVCNFPIVAWKRVIFAPLAAMAIAELRRRKVVLIQHEWSGLHWLRRITCMPTLLLADTTFYMHGTDVTENAAAVAGVREQYPDLKMVGRCHGFLRGEALRAKVAEVNALAPDYLWVALGVPYEQAFVETRRLFWRYLTTNPRALYLLLNRNRPTDIGGTHNR